ncbi:soluble guanylate cyclase 88E isoform X4 [Octopus sinensis]|uniref:guanylate cyclase n=1 Tax=Octopus sinensis TaxID=2607531 RepID=A0A7E6F6L5_9MOLL|nr:soluble guanylate cyclase 88E isoform X4 [Octopus sinensis]
MSDEIGSTLCPVSEETGEDDTKICPIKEEIDKDGRKDKMYGIIIQAIVIYLQETYGEETWEAIRQRAGIEEHSFSLHERYKEDTIVRICDAASRLIGVDRSTIMNSFGDSFVAYVSKYNYDRILKVLGRNLRDFLNGLDNLHEYLRFSYQNIVPPSFFCENEHKMGLHLHYRSSRKGFVHYVIGQIKAVGKTFYDTDIDVKIIKHEESADSSHVIFDLRFQNEGFDTQVNNKIDDKDQFKVPAYFFRNLFPFHIQFKKNMDIVSAGSGLRAIIPNITSKNLLDVFILRKPVFQFNWKNESFAEKILMYTNNVFELESNENITRHRDCVKRLAAENEEGQEDNEFSSTHLYLKGQMMLVEDWNCLMFLGTPVMKSLDNMFATGLFINDLSMHDCSRDLVLAGHQQSAELKLALDQEKLKSAILEKSMQRLDKEMKRTDTLLYQMIPKSVADRLRDGEDSLDTCEMFDSVTILFSDVVGFTSICSMITPMEVVGLLNSMYTIFDNISEKHQVYKVETIGDAYMLVSGAPVRIENHPVEICNMALDMVSEIDVVDSTEICEKLRIRIGIHTGPCVAGVVGVKMPRYCLFGDTVNTAARMETNGEAMKIHISESTMKAVPPNMFDVMERGEIDVKEKSRRTYWLLGSLNST